MCQKIVPLLIVIMLIITGCAGSVPITAGTATPAQAQPTQTPTTTRTPVPTETPRPTHTPTPTETSLPTATPLPTRDPALGETKLIGLAWFENYDMLVSFQFPGPVNADDYRVTVADKEYRCEVITGFPDRLYCRGQGAKVLAVTQVRIYQNGIQQPGFEKDVWVPFFDNNYSSYYEDPL